MLGIVMLHMGKGTTKGDCVTCVVGGGLLSRFQHVLVGYCLSSTERVYESARLSCCG